MINPGDIVWCLGGPGRLTVSHVFNDGAVLAYYFDDAGEFCVGVYPEKDLRLILGSKYWG